MTNWIKSDVVVSSLTLFSRDGRMLVSVFKDETGEVRNFLPTSNSGLELSDENLAALTDLNEYSFAEFLESKKITLVTISKVFATSGRHVGYIEQILDLDRNFLARIKDRMKLETFFMKPGGPVVVASHPDFSLYPRTYFSDMTAKEKEPAFELNVRNVPYVFLIYPMTWGETSFHLGLGASKVEAKEVLQNVNYAFYTVVGAVILLLILTVFVASNWLLKPLYELVNAIQNFQEGDTPVEIPIKNETEVGLLTESFNDMSFRIHQARQELQKKITELEKTNDDLKETQAKLVHSAKMASLGQLVAGVAHELNNPIGFIYSNMAHLRDYSSRLLDFADIVEKDPKVAKKMRAEMEIDYIHDDLPKLITSCEDGAKRIKDIVLGLRTFSRLEEAKVKEVDIHEGLDNTLNLLAGEIKNRIQVHREYGEIPAVSCNPSQINQVFMNILSNAVQAIEGNGEIWLYTKVRDNFNGQRAVEISIQDSGKGMPKAVLEKIFDPFFTTKPVGQGTGLGLSISYGIIQNHGGEIQVETDPGVGTEFRITLPLRPPVGIAPSH
jgi:two-component system NtrC family sensor kinase